MLQGLYKVEFETPRRKAVGVIFAENGKLHGGSSAFAYIGSYRSLAIRSPASSPPRSIPRTRIIRRSLA
jgi:hypothetical protein